MIMYLSSNKQKIGVATIHGKKKRWQQKARIKRNQTKHVRTRECRRFDVSGLESLTSIPSQSTDPDPYCSRHWWEALYRTPGSTGFRDSLSFTGGSSRHQPHPRLSREVKEGGGWLKKKKQRKTTKQHNRPL